MTDHRPPTAKNAPGDNLTKAVDNLTSDGQKSTSWVAEAAKTAYTPIGFIKDSAEHAPVGTAITLLGIGVGIYGAVKTGLPARAMAALGEAEIVGGGTKAVGAAGTEAIAGREALAATTDTLANSAKTMVHLTTKEGQAGIASSLKIGSRWGVFALDSAQVPENGLVRSVASLVPRDLSAEVAIGPRASSYFQAPTPVGPFTLARNLAGVKSAPLGSINLAKDAFIPNEIFADGVFRPATAGEVTKFKVHQYILDYAIDSLGYTLAGVSTAALEYKKICEKSDQRQAQWQAERKAHLQAVNLKTPNRQTPQDAMLQPIKPSS